MSSLEDKTLALQVRHAIGRTPLDLTQVTVTCRRGTIELVGTARKPRDFRGEMDVKKEIVKLKQIVANVRGVTEVYSSQLRFLE